MTKNEEIKKAIEMLEKGKCIVYPTDTLYAFGVDAENKKALSLLRKIKERDLEKNFLIMVRDFSMLFSYGEENALSRKIAKHFLPGALTLILKTKKDSLKEIYGESIGLRMPKNEICKDLCTFFKRGIISTSVNKKGYPPEKTIKNIKKIFSFYEKDIFFIDGGEKEESIPSTIIDVRGNTPLILREGKIKKEEIDAFLVQK
jgi:L-threonylcarbamoyladenylate synthase